MPKKMRRLALRCLLSDKVANGELKVIGSLELDEPKTKGIIQILDALGAKPSTLLVTADADANVYKSARNLSRVKTLPAPLLNVVDLLSYRVLVATVDAVRRAEAIWGKESAKGIAS
jgi:large subunit ribosomal protein L4